MYGRLHRTNLGGASASALGSGPDDSDQLHRNVVVPAAVVSHSDQLLAAVLETTRCQRLASCTQDVLWQR